MPENWQEVAKQAYLYEQSRGGHIEIMLERTAVNSRENVELARFNAWTLAQTDTWRGNYKGLFDDITEDLQDHLLRLDAFARNQAVELAGAVARGEALAQAGDVTIQKRGGLLGLLGFK